MKFQTAIFYDIENLTKGNSFSRDFIKNFSLKKIYNQIKKLEIVERIALQRAYANWSDSRLSILKGDINELGIDPIQIFGFARHQIKNAADIQLAVDAMDVVLTRKHIEVYVIVSGDGGFATLAKKLHEYGHQVIGCAYSKASNEILKSVCDYFIELETPEEFTYNNDNYASLDNDKGYGIGITHPLVVRMAKNINPINTNITSEIINQSNSIINWFSQDSEARKQIKSKGIHLSTIREAFKYAIQNFELENMGFIRFSEYLQLICTNSDLCVATRPPSDTLLFLRELIPRGIETLPDLTEDKLHSIQRYQNLLGSGKPRIIINDKYDLQQVTNCIFNHREKELDMSDLLDTLNAEVVNIENDTLYNICISLIHCDVLHGRPEDKNLSEQKFQLRKDFEDVSQVSIHLKDMALNKLKSFLNDDFKMGVFEEAIDW